MLPRLWPRLLRRVKQRCRARTTHVGAAIEPLEELVMLANWSGDIPNGTVWTNAEVQRIIGDARVPIGANLTIEPGSVIKFMPSSGMSLLVEGMLSAQGTAEQPIFFTSDRDDSVGGDSNGDGASTGSQGDWNGIVFTGTGGLDHVEARYGGSGHFLYPPGMIVVDGGELTLTNSTLRDSYADGLRIIDASPTLAGNTFRDNRLTAISMDLASSPVIGATTFVNNAVNAVNLVGGTLASDAHWNNPQVAYHLSGEVLVPTGRTLTIDPGMVVKGSVAAPPAADRQRHAPRRWHARAADHLHLEPGRHGRWRYGQQRRPAGPGRLGRPATRERHESARSRRGALCPRWIGSGGRGHGRWRRAQLDGESDPRCRTARAAD